MHSFSGGLAEPREGSCRQPLGLEFLSCFHLANYFPFLRLDLHWPLGPGSPGSWGGLGAEEWRDEGWETQGSGLRAGG